MAHAPLGAAEVAAIAQGVRARDRGAVARALDLVEDRRAQLRQAQRGLLRALHGAPRGRTIGVTGPPGAGKSTLCAVLVRALRGNGARVGVVAVDPSSVESGGAILGDRLRIVPGAPDEGVFVRSLAAGGELGGLARTASVCVDVLAAASDVVLIETVGVGQSEVAVARVADLIVLVVQPSSGDALQFLKAGVLEIPDVIVIGKSDLGDVARRAEAELQHALGVSRAIGRAAPEVLLASGATGDGVERLLATLDERAEALDASGERAGRRDRAALDDAFGAVRRAVGELGLDALGGERAVRARLAAALAGGAAPFDAAEDVILQATVSRRSPGNSGPAT